ncbi:MAG TPA: hypothetical protein PLX66_01650 [Bacilli bacterium]|nr:hypothetical protein [Bacilli bacterium]
MKSFILKNKGVIAFYMLIITLSLGCTYRLNNLHSETRTSYTIPEYQLKGNND